MNIVIDVAAYYDWEPMASAPAEGDVLALKAKAADNGKWLKKVLKESATHTVVSMPESEILDCMAHFARRGAPKTRARTVAWYLEEVVMPHHSHPEHFTKIVVHDEPEVEEYLNKYFDTGYVPEAK